MHVMITSFICQHQRLLISITSPIFQLLLLKTKEAGTISRLLIVMFLLDLSKAAYMIYLNHSHPKAHILNHWRVHTDLLNLCFPKQELLSNTQLLNTTPILLWGLSSILVSLKSRRLKKWMIRITVLVDRSISSLIQVSLH